MTRETIVLIHSITGITVFITGFLQIILKKGGKTHRIVGQIYTYTWIFLLLTGAYIGSFLITMLGVFGFYLAFTGARLGHLKSNNFTVLDKGFIGLGGLVSLYMLYLAISLYLKGDMSFAIIIGVFGLIFLQMSGKDISKYIFDKPIGKQKFGKQDWYFEHLIRMGASFIAAVTAFTSIQNVFNNTVLNFLMPTVVGTALITWGVKTFKRKFGIE